ncbi:hypothetical protein [Streptomyces sp. NBC_00887]|nr:hypothetical protein OG844_03995 [Streptomyces sp. NBC_00887]WSY35746.1 hypothetical protein OG844_41605 [Streptomyces sp. NBC_00887]
MGTLAVADRDRGPRLDEILLLEAEPAAGEPTKLRYRMLWAWSLAVVG